MYGHIISHHHGFIKSPYPGFTPSFPVCFFQTSATVASTLYPPQTPFLLPTPVPTPIYCGPTFLCPTPVPTPIYCGPTFLCPTPVTMVPSIILGHTHSYPPVQIATPILSAPVEINRQWILNSNVLVHASSLIQARNWEISRGNLGDQGINKQKFGELLAQRVKTKITNKTATFRPEEGGTANRAPGEGGVKIKTDQVPVDRFVNSQVKANEVATQNYFYSYPYTYATTPDHKKANCGLHSLQKVTAMSENRGATNLDTNSTNPSSHLKPSNTDQVIIRSREEVL